MACQSCIKKRTSERRLKLGIKELMEKIKNERTKRDTYGQKKN